MLIGRLVINRQGWPSPPVFFFRSAPIQVGDDFKKPLELQRAQFSPTFSEAPGFPHILHNS
jgi:hypothetical protein